MTSRRTCATSRLTIVVRSGRGGNSSSAPALVLLMLAVTLVGACAAPADRPSEAGGSAQQAPSRTTKRLAAAIRGTPANLSQTRTLRTVGSVPGLDGIEE